MFTVYIRVMQKGNESFKLMLTVQPGDYSSINFCTLYDDLGFCVLDVNELWTWWNIFITSWPASQSAAVKHSKQIYIYHVYDVYIHVIACDKWDWLALINTWQNLSCHSFINYLGYFCKKMFLDNRYWNPFPNLNSCIHGFAQAWYLLIRPW